MRQSTCDVGYHVNFYCGFMLSMFCPVNTPVSKLKRSRIDSVNVSQFESREFALMFAMTKATCLLRINSDKVAKC